MNKTQFKSMSPMERLVYWISERERIRIEKARRESQEEFTLKPLTKCRVMSQYRFCNVVRMDDRVSQWLYNEWYYPNHNHKNMVPAIAMARCFNKPSTLEAIGFPQRWNLKQWEKKLIDMKKTESVFNAAYIIRAENHEDKVTSVLFKYVKPLIDNPPDLDRSSMEACHAEIMGYHGFGSFMAGQIVADMRWAIGGTWLDRNDWAPMGPGSQRGMNRLVGNDVDDKWHQEDWLEQLHETRYEAEKSIPRRLARRMEMHDWQNCLCEYDKFCRFYTGDGRPKQKWSMQ